MHWLPCSKPSLLRQSMRIWYAAYSHPTPTVSVRGHSYHFGWFDCRAAVLYAQYSLPGKSCQRARHMPWACPTHGQTYASVDRPCQPARNEGRHHQRHGTVARYSACILFNHLCLLVNSMDRITTPASGYGVHVVSHPILRYGVAVKQSTGMCIPVLCKQPIRQYQTFRQKWQRSPVSHRIASALHAQ